MNETNNTASITVPTSSPITSFPSTSPTTLAPTSPPTTLSPTEGPTTAVPTLSPTISPTFSPTAPLTGAPTFGGEEYHEFGASNALLLVGVLILCIISGYWLRRKKFHYLPESGASMLIGMLVGGVARLIEDERKLDLLKFDPEVFFFVLLPPIIFEAGFTLKKKRFFSNIGTISLFAVAGTLISTFIVGGLTHVSATAGLVSVKHDTMLHSLLFGALISSVDPVATLAIIGSPEMNCDPLLYSLVFGESVLNDAAAIVLFRVFNEYSDGDGFGSGDMLQVVLQFFGISLGSLVVGIGSGLLCSLAFRRTMLREYHTFEIQVVVLSAFGCFALAELTGLSGVMALFFCGVTLSHYNFHNMSQQTKVSSTYVFEALASSSETLVFAYMGMSLFTSSARWEPLFIFLGVIFCMIGRAMNIFPLSFVANRFRGTPIPARMQAVMFYAGLRGAVAYALAQQLDDTHRSVGVQVIQTTTLGIVIFTTFFLGGTTSQVLERLEMKRPGFSSSMGALSPAAGPIRTGSEGDLREDFSRYQTLDAQGGTRATPNEFSNPVSRPENGMRRPSRTSEMWSRLDENILMPLFSSDPNNTREDGPNFGSIFGQESMMAGSIDRLSGRQVPPSLELQNMGSDSAVEQLRQGYHPPESMTSVVSPGASDAQTDGEVARV